MPRSATISTSSPGILRYIIDEGDEYTHLLATIADFDDFRCHAEKAELAVWRRVGQEADTKSVDTEHHFKYRARHRSSRDVGCLHYRTEMRVELPPHKALPGTPERHAQHVREVVGRDSP